VAAVCFAGVVALLLRPEAGAPASAAPSPATVALLDGLQPGDTLSGWTVLGIDGPREEAIRIDLAHKDVRFAITVAPLGALPESPAMQTDLHALYYGHAHPDEASIPPGATKALLANIARRVRRNER
jgi:hypothetical protein